MRITLIENFRALFYAPYYAACALGAYEAEGLEVELRMAAELGKALQAVNAGAGQVSWGGPLRILSALDRDPKCGYVAFCEVVGRDPFFLVGRAPNPGFQLAELPRWSLAAVSEVPTPWLCLQHDVRRAGADPSAVRLARGRTMAENADALRAGEVDVIQVFQPYARALVEAGAGHVWYSAASRGPTAYTTFNTTRSYLEREPDTALRLTRAMYRTLKWIAARDGRALAEAIAGYFPDLPAARLAACCDDYRSRGLWNRTPLPQREGLEWLRDAMLAGGAIRTRFSYEDCVDTRFAEQVVRENPAATGTWYHASPITHYPLRKEQRMAQSNDLPGVLETTEAERLATGFVFTEGPLWHPEGYWYFVDIRQNKLYRMTPGKAPEVFKETAGGNGTTFDLQGRLVICEGDGRRVSRVGHDGRLEVLVDRFQGGRFNRPNDVVCRSDGALYFTDPDKRRPYHEREIPGPAGIDNLWDGARVYRAMPDGGVSVLAHCEYPNGLAFSPDERTLYVANTRSSKYIHALELDAAGNMTRRRIFADMNEGTLPGIPDGLKVDSQGRVYCTGPGGIWVFTPEAKRIGIIRFPEQAVNFAFGGPDLRTLFCCAYTSVYTLRVKVAGNPHPWYLLRR